MRVITPCLFLIAVASCAASEAKTADDLSVVLASVTLADQCPTAKPPPPPPPAKFAKPPATAKDEAPPPPNAVAARRGSCAQPGPCGSPQRHCDQTSMQLSFTPATDLKNGSVKIKRVELIDAKGKVVQVLTASAPMQWSAAAGAYIAWNEKMAGKDPVRASYNLSSPDWNKLTGGRMNAPSHTFQLRVIVTVGGSDRTVEKTAIVPARVEPMVVT